jgi:hypothetical protein
MGLPASLMADGFGGATGGATGTGTGGGGTDGGASVAGSGRSTGAGGLGRKVWTASTSSGAAISVAMAKVR